jgi:hypothetical protein
LAFDGLMRGTAELAEDAIESTRLRRHQIDAERVAEPARMHRAEEMAILLNDFHGFSSLRALYKCKNKSFVLSPKFFYDCPINAAASEAA